MHNRVRRLTLAAFFAAMIFLITALPQIHIPAPGGQGYVHLGDSILYFSACFLPGVYAVAAAVIGAGFADLALGSAIYLLPTVIIKAVMALCFSARGSRVVCGRNVLGAVLASAVLVGGYFAADLVLFGNLAVALVNLPWNGFQAAGNCAVFFALGAVLDKIRLKERLAAGENQTRR